MRVRIESLSLYGFFLFAIFKVHILYEFEIVYEVHESFISGLEQLFCVIVDMCCMCSILCRFEERVCTTLLGPKT